MVRGASGGEASSRVTPQAEPWRQTKQRNMQSVETSLYVQRLSLDCQSLPQTGRWPCDGGHRSGDQRRKPSRRSGVEKLGKSQKHFIEIWKERLITINAKYEISKDGFESDKRRQTDPKVNMHTCRHDRKRKSNEKRKQLRKRCETGKKYMNHEDD